MKKPIYILLLLPFFAIGQVSNGTEFEQEAFRATNNQTVTTSDFITTTGADGTQGKILGENISLSVIPPVQHFTPITSSIKGYFQGVDDALGNVVATTAGITTRLWLTADQTTITAGTFYKANFVNKGIVASATQSVSNNDNEKKYFTQDIIGDAYVTITTFPKGVYAGNLSVSTTPNSAQQRFTVEVYKCNNTGTPIASGISGAVTGSLGVTVIAILDSGLLTLADGSVTNVPVSASIEFPFTINVGERVRYHISAEKVGTTGASITESLWLGTSYNSYIDVPVPLNTSAVQNLSNVAGATTTDALNTLNTGKEDKSNKATDFATVNNTLYPSVQAIKTYVDGLIPTNYSKIVYVNNVNPNSATIFDLANPPTTNNNTLKIDVNNLYIGSDASTWVYNGSTYVTKIIMSAGSFNVWNVKNYGALGNGVADDTAAIQNTINLCISAGGGIVYFPNGVYVIAGSLVTSDNLGANPNSQLYIPASDSDSATKTAITFLGETEPNFTPSAFTGTFGPTMKGVILLSTLTTVSGTNPSVFGTKHPTSFGNINYTNVGFENITVLVNKDPFGYGPVIGGLNMMNTSTSFFNKVIVNINGSMTANTNLPTAEIAGIVVSKTNAEFTTSVKNTIVTGFRYGIIIGEHCSLDQVSADGCYAGFVFTQTFHSIAALRIFGGWNKYTFYFPTTSIFGLPVGTCQLTISNLDMELWKSSGKWNESEFVIYDPSNYAKGVVWWHSVRSNVGIDPTLFTKSGGANLLCIQIEKPFYPLYFSGEQLGVNTDTPSTFVSQTGITGNLLNIKSTVAYARTLLQGATGGILALADIGSSSANSKRFEFRNYANKGYIEGVNDAGTALTYSFIDFDLANGEVYIRKAKVNLKNYTVATLPTGVQGDTAYVTDALAPTYLGVLVGGGSVKCPVFYNGTAWVSH